MNRELNTCFFLYNRKYLKLSFNKTSRSLDETCLEIIKYNSNLQK